MVRYLASSYNKFNNFDKYTGMDDFFAIGSQVWRFIEKLLDPATYSSVTGESVWMWGALGLVFILASLIILKNRRARQARSQRLEELEKALLDEDFEDRSLALPESETLEDEDEDWGDEEESERPLFNDPVFGKNIVITADSSRKQTPVSPEPEETPYQDESEGEIEREFARLEEELREKELEVRRRHNIQKSAPKVEEVESEPQPPIAESKPPVYETTLEEQDELDELLAEPLGANFETPDPSELEREMQQSIAELSQTIDPPGEAIWGQGSGDLISIEEEKKARAEQTILQLEEFQKDMEHRFQTHTLEHLTERNHELVEALELGGSTRETRQAEEENQHNLAALEVLMAGNRIRK